MQKNILRFFRIFLDFRESSRIFLDLLELSRIFFQKFKISKIVGNVFHYGQCTRRNRRIFHHYLRRIPPYMYRYIPIYRYKQVFLDSISAYPQPTHLIFGAVKNIASFFHRKSSAQVVCRRILNKKSYKNVTNIWKHTVYHCLYLPFGAHGWHLCEDKLGLRRSI